MGGASFPFLQNQAGLGKSMGSVQFPGEGVAAVERPLNQSGSLLD